MLQIIHEVIHELGRDCSIDSTSALMHIYDVNKMDVIDPYTLLSFPLSYMWSAMPNVYELERPQTWLGTITNTHAHLNL